MKKAMAYTSDSLKSRYGLGLLFLMLLSVNTLQAQSITPQTLNVTGGYAEVGGYSLGYSVGEESSISHYTTSTASTLSAGFIQNFGFLDQDHLVLDLSLSNASFTGSTSQFFIPVGDFSVKTSRTTTSTKAPLFTSLYGPGYDNQYFYINDNALFWNSADPAPGKETFLILAQVLDRKGNRVAKFFEIKRSRTAFSSLTVSNTFTPNGDGVNDKWAVPGLRFYDGARISVFDKDGNRMFYTEIPDLGWDGSYNGKQLPIGSYFWVIEAIEVGEIRRGILNLIRK
jgi:gliding motility-associated-like protein